MSSVPFPSNAQVQLTLTHSPTTGAPIVGAQAPNAYGKVVRVPLSTSGSPPTSGVFDYGLVTDVSPGAEEDYGLVTDL
jgi:hypothetical protein